jgi:prepilin-type N-terminal cleavage/methylation domain-containing protein
MGKKYKNQKKVNFGNFKQNSRSSILKGFTLIELLVVISIVGLLASVVLMALNGVREKAKSSLAVTNQRQLQKAVELYYNDMGFYPPDVNRGWDPGLAKALPSNPDPEVGIDCNTNTTQCDVGNGNGVVCSNCPTNWINQVQARWKGPYIAKWPNTAPWGGKYDFNNWLVPTVRYGCTVPGGVYIGTQRNYDDTNPIPQSQEQWFLSQNLDADQCLNGEVQLQLIKY